MNKILERIILSTCTLMLSAGLSGCGTNPYKSPEATDMKDMSSAGYEYSMFQRADGTSHNREIQFVVDKMAQWPDISYNLLEGSYQNTGTEAPEHLRDLTGNKILVQSEMRRYFDFWDNAREDQSNIMLFDPVSESIYTTTMARFKTEWWGDSDVRAISVDNGPIYFRLSGITNHLGIETQQVFAVVIPEKDTEYEWMFNQDNAGKVKNYFTDLAETLEKTQFNPDNYHVLISTRDSDSGLDFMGIERFPAQGELYDGKVQYVIAASYAGPNNKVLRGGVMGTDIWGHPGAPDKGNKLGVSLDTVMIGLGNISRPNEWEPKAKIIVNHPQWSNQTEYEFYKVNKDGSETKMGVLQRTYNDKTVTEKTDDNTTVITDLSGTNNYLAKGNLQFMQDTMILMGGQQIPLGFDYKTSYLDYALDLIIIGDGLISEEGMNPEMSASLNVNADATINNVIRAAENVLGVKTPEAYQEYSTMQSDADTLFQETVRANPVLSRIYGIE